MSVKLTDLAKELGLTSTELKDKIVEFGFDIKKTARTIDEEVAELVKAEITGADSNNDDILDDEDDKEKGAAGVYEEIIDKQLDREIIKKQRKLTAGVDKKKQDQAKERGTQVVEEKKSLEIPDLISVKEFAEKTGLNAAKIIGELMKNGILANINQQIDFDTAQIIAEDLGVEIRRKQKSSDVHDVIAGDLAALFKEDDSANLEPRPPIVVVMGHVDHGKTKLLDSIREADVVSGEHGGITQHIAAYQVEKNGRKISFLDTPGHEAFTAMRARGAKVTDVAILVVAADEGVKPQTIEALNHAKDAGVPIIVAINKIDKENANIDKVKGELAEHGLQSEDWGGTTIMVPISALTGKGIPELLDMVLLVADMQNLTANPDRPAIGTVIEAHLDKNLGPVATVLVNIGTLKVMDNIFVGGTYGRVKSMKDQYGKNIRKAGPSLPVVIAGLNETPQSGDIICVAKNEKEAREKSMTVRDILNTQAKGSLAEITAKINAGELKTVKLVLKADVKGTLEALVEQISKIKNDDVGVKVIHAAVGNVTGSDVNMAGASGGVVFGFNVNILPQVDRIAERLGVDIVQYNIIYKLLEDLRQIVTGLLEPEIIEISVGKLEVKQVFFAKRSDQIFGGKVLSGKMIKKARIRVIRNEEILGEGDIINLKKVDKEVNEIGEGNDCGIKYKGDVLVEVGDILEAYTTEKRARTLED